MGQICCRFEDETDNIRHLGGCLRSFQRGSFAPYFTVTEDDFDLHPMDTIPITESTIRQMVDFATFCVSAPTIRLSNANAKTTISLILRHVAGSVQVPLIRIPISGFPRQLRKEDEITRMSCHCTLLK